MHPIIQKTFGALLTLAVLVGCGNGGSKFEGKWSCHAGSLGMLTVSIRNNGGNDYIIDDYPMIGKLSVTYQDGKLVSPEGIAFSIDKQSDKLIGMNICEMSRAK